MFRQVLLALAVCSVLAERKRYDGYQVWEVKPTNQHQVEVLKALEAETQVVFWNEHVKVGFTAEILIPPTEVSSTWQRLQAGCAVYTTLQTNLQESLDEIWKRVDSPQRAYDPDDYNTYEDIMSELDRLAAEECPPGFQCDIETNGQSIDGRDIQALHISLPGSGHPLVWMDSLIHAREWLAGSTNMRILDRLLTEYGTNDEATYLLDNYDWYYTPVANPDGYAYTFSNDRYWRKNRNPNTGGCAGVDLNRNFEIYYNQGGSSGSTCSETYHGVGPASEPEVQVYQNTLQRLISAQTVVAQWSIHTAVPALLMPTAAPSGFFCMEHPDHVNLQRVADAAADAIEERHGTTWPRGNACEVLYGVSGSTMDFASWAGVQYPYVPELRGPGFAPPASAIQPSFEEVWDGVVAMMNEIEAIGKH